MDVQKLLKPNIRSLRAYHAEEIPCRVKLDANESPYSGVRGQGSEVRVNKTLQLLNRYPDPQAKALRKLMAKELKVKPENILHGNGSDELIYYLITAFGGPVLYPVPTFSMYGIISQALNEKGIGIPLDSRFDLDIDKIIQTIKKNKPKLIFLSSPNNPTGNCFSSDRILKVIKATSSHITRHPSLVIVDEAYQPFSGKNEFLPLLDKFKNLVIMRTLSKIGLAGLRLGFLIADEEIIHAVNTVRLPFNVNALSQKAAVEALKNKKQMHTNISSIISERKRLLKEMKKIRGVTPYPSDANFILFKVKNADTIYNSLLHNGVLIRNMSGVIDNCLRVTVGTPKENRIFLHKLKRLS
ncbi:MAG: histidinol-phosphate transaminase [Nitrospiraceae bacterium]|nr:MAG: histidinol-phosphate transaminase [Nitrospiraceae bacterium]